jgi:hypothetical protein
MIHPQPSTHSDIASAIDVNGFLRAYVAWADHLHLRVDGLRPTAKRQRRKRARLESALREAEKAGRVVTSATVEGDKISLTFGEGESVPDNEVENWFSKQRRYAD